MLKAAVAALVTAIVIVGGASAYSAAVTPSQFAALRSQVSALKLQVSTLQTRLSNDENLLSTDATDVQTAQGTVACLLDRWNKTGYITQDEIVWNTVAHLSGLTDPNLVIPVIPKSSMVLCR